MFLDKTTDTRVGTDGDGSFDEVERNVVSGNYSEIGVFTGNAYLYGLEVVDRLISGEIPSIQSTQTIATANLSDANQPENGAWNYNNPIPGLGGDDYALVTTGTIQVATEGTYSFAISGNDGGRLRIDGQEIIVNDSAYSYSYKYGQATLSAGQHSIEWTSFQRNGLAGWELSVSDTINNFTPISSTNGWKVLGDPNPHSNIRLSPSTNLSVKSYKVSGSEITNILLAGNYIGSNADGTAAISNGQIGVQVSHSRFVTIGGSNPAMANVFPARVSVSMIMVLHLRT